MCEKMDVVNKETEDNSMEDVTMASSSMTPMCTLAHLAAKLENLMQTDMMHTTTMEIPMESDTKEQKK